MPYKMKMVSLTQEVVRILRNTSTNEDDVVRKYFLSEFSLGYRHLVTLLDSDRQS